MTKESDYLLTNQEILGGIQAAVAKGESLKDAMMTFYQAGYEKEEIEDAARSYMNQMSASQIPTTANARTITTNNMSVAKPVVQQKATSQQPIVQQKIPIQAGVQKMNTIPIPNVTSPTRITKQNISAYETTKKKAPEGNTLTIFLVIILLLLIGILATVFLLKDELQKFLGGLF
jgi:putative cell wall-binding protein